MENQNDQAFEADQDINAFERIPSRSAHSSHQGHDAMKAAFGAFESQDNNDNERTALLGRDRGSDQDRGDNTDSGEADGRGPPTWDGERDFEGRPWWNTPSVSRRVSSTLPNTEWFHCRSTGSSHHLPSSP